MKTLWFSKESTKQVGLLKEAITLKFLAEKVTILLRDNNANISHLIEKMIRLLKETMRILWIVTEEEIVLLEKATTTASMDRGTVGLLL